MRHLGWRLGLGGWLLGMAVGLGSGPVGRAADPSPVPLVVSATFDRWMYPFNATPGQRTVGSTFGAPGEPLFDDADAQILIGFPITADVAPPGLGLDKYQVTSVRVRLTTATDRSFRLDTTSDPVGSYTGVATDPDAGRPVELFGVGFRNGYLQAGFGSGAVGPTTFEETDPFSSPGPPAPRQRAAFISDFDQGGARDVSNFVRDQLDVQPWAVGAVAGLDPGAEVPVLSTVDFQLDLSRSEVLDYVRQGLHQGGLVFGIASLHQATSGSSQGIPSFYLGHPTLGSPGQVAQLELELAVVPEPAGMSLIAAGVGALAFVRNRRRVLHQS